MSTIRSLITGRASIGSIVSVSLASVLTRTLQDRLLNPLIRIASEPQTPWAQE